MGSIKGLAASSSLSVEEIVCLFERIDEQILELHRCSSDDFLGLNAKFKGFYKETKGISTSAGALLLLFSEGANRKLIASLEEFYERLTKSQIQLTKQLYGSLDTMLVIRNVLGALYLPLRNIAQNTSTMSLLLANLDLAQKSPKLREPGGAALFQQLRAEVDQLVRDAQVIGQQVKGFGQRLAAAQLQVESIQNQALRGVESVTNAVHYGLILFAEKHEEANIRIPELTEKTDSSSKSIAGIITNLQYQDIIRQKMEHIQTAHQRLMEGLSQMSGDAAADEQYYVRMLVQVRDISALQSAQLVATNREYQGAIETIARHFREIATDMEHIADLCRESLRIGGQSGSSSSMASLVERLRQSSEVLGGFSSVVPVLRDEMGALSAGCASLCEMIDARQVRYRSVRERILALVAPEVIESEEENALDVTAQIQSVLEDLDHFGQEVGVQTEQLYVCRGTLEGYETQLHGSMPLWDSFQQGASEIHNIALSLAVTENESTELLGKIESMSKKVSQDTRQGLDEIRYYDFFASIIGEIIEGLNAISAKIRAEVTVEMSADIDEYRGLYTMASEHHIHDSFAEGEEGDVDLFGSGVIDDSDVTDDDDGLELF